MKRQYQAWAYLLGTFKPDIALLQEVRCPRAELVDERGRAFAFQGGEFGTMVFCLPDLALEMSVDKAASHCSSDLYISATDVHGIGDPLVLMSVHVYPGKEQRQSLQKLIEILDNALRKTPSIVGGDFNTCRHFDLVYKRNAYGWFFEEMERTGLYDCHFGLHGEERQTYWSKKSKEPYQDDHFFVPMSWRSKVVSCDVLPYDPVREMSDHSPMELVVDP